MRDRNSFKTSINAWSSEAGVLLKQVLTERMRSDHKYLAGQPTSYAPAIQTTCSLRALETDQETLAAQLK